MGQINISIIYQEVKTALRNSGIENYVNEAGFIIEKVTGIRKSQIPIKEGYILSDNQIRDIKNLVNQRKSGQPLQYILGEWEFYGLPFYVGEGVLIPRQDTETLVDDTLQRLKDLQEPYICDLCSGSGCIAISIDKNVPKGKVFAVEKYKQAFSYLKKNIKRNNADITTVLGDVTDKETLESIPMMDCVVSNPPYLTKTDMENLQKEVTFEPKTALKAGEDGLYFYREITSLWKKKIKKDGFVSYEVGINQHEDVKNILFNNGFKDIFMIKDLCGIIRVVGGYR